MPPAVRINQFEVSPHPAEPRRRHKGGGTDQGPISEGPSVLPWLIDGAHDPTMTIAVPAPSPSAVAPDPIDVRNRVVVGMDDDPASVAALRFAATEAAYRGGDVLAVHVWRYPAMWGYPVWPEQVDLGSFITDQLRQTSHAVLAERSEAGEPTVSITVEVVQGVTAPTLHRAARDAALLVLGARHHSLVLGSVSRACSNHPPCPVVVVPLPPRP